MPFKKYFVDCTLRYTYQLIMCTIMIKALESFSNRRISEFIVKMDNDMMQLRPLDMAFQKTFSLCKWNFWVNCNFMLNEISIIFTNFQMEVYYSITFKKIESQYAWIANGCNRSKSYSLAFTSYIYSICYI